MTASSRIKTLGSYRLAAALRDNLDIRVCTVGSGNAGYSEWREELLCGSNVRPVLGSLRATSSWHCADGGGHVD